MRRRQRRGGWFTWPSSMGGMGSRGMGGLNRVRGTEYGAVVCRDRWEGGRMCEGKLEEDERLPEGG